MCGILGSGAEMTALNEDDLNFDGSITIFTAR
jgi:hypothetical protein